MSQQPVVPVGRGGRAQRVALVRSLWCEVLGVAEVADDVNFYAAGGDSLGLLALVERIRQESGVRVRPADVLRAGTVAAQAELLAEPPAC